MNTSEKLSILEFMEKHNLYLINHYNAYAICTDLKDLGRVFLANSSLPPVGTLSKELPVNVYTAPVFIGDLHQAYAFISELMLSSDIEDATVITPQDLGIDELRKTSLDMGLV